MSAIVDVQGFKSEDNRFILKEIAILCNDQLQVFLFKPPYPYYKLSETERLQVVWIERNRRIKWNEGFISYSNHEDIITNILNDKYIYTKGLEKLDWIKKMTKNSKVYNLEDKGCPKLMDLYEQYKSSNEVFNCIYHPTICALKNVTCLRKWCIDNKVLI